MNFKTILPALALAAVLSPLAATSQAEAAKVRAGTLTCRVGGGAGMLIVSSKPVDCVFRGRHGVVERYTGSINKVGVDVGFTFGGRLGWAVFEPTASRNPHLAGRYSGASAEATALIGVGANVLLGGGRGDITLQPISLQGQTGINVAGGIGSLIIEPVATGYAEPAYRKGYAPAYRQPRYHSGKSRHAKRHHARHYKQRRSY